MKTWQNIPLVPYLSFRGAHYQFLMIVSLHVDDEINNNF